MERAINHFVEKVEEAGNAEIEKIGVNSEQQYESRTLQYQWESFQVVFTILRNNGKLNHVYCAVIDKALEFCLRLKRTKEFKKLNDTVRRRFGYVINNQQFDYALKINSQDTLNSMLKVRLGMLKGALSMGLHQESFKTIKGTQKNIIDRSYDLKKNINSVLFADFYERLAEVFWSSNRFLLHSYSLFEGYKKLKQHIYSKLKGKRFKEQRAEQEKRLYKMFHEALLAVLIVPSSAINDKNKTNSGNPATANNKYFTHSLFQLANDYFGHGRRKQIKPSQQGLLQEIMAEVHQIHAQREKKLTVRQSPSGDEDKEECDPLKNAKDLYHLMASNTFNPLTFTKSLNDIMVRLETENGVNGKLYRGKMYEKGVTMLLKQLSVCYKSISWERLSQLTFPKEQLGDIELERIITYSVYYDGTKCTISHSKKLVSFHDKNLESEILSDSIVELNRSLMNIKRTKNLDVTDPMQRKNVYNTIRNQVVNEHKRIDYRLWKGQQQRVAERVAREEKERMRKKKIEEEKRAREAKKKEEIRTVMESKKKIAAQQIQEKEKEEMQLKTKKKVMSFLDAMKAPTASASTTKKTKNVNTSKIAELQNNSNKLQSDIEKKIKRAAFNDEEVEPLMMRLVHIENKKKRKMLQIEKMEFDHFCRAKRRYLQKQIQEEMDRLNDLNIDQRKRLFKQLNKENKQKHADKVRRRDRLRDLQAKHLKTFRKIVRDERNRTQSKQRKQQPAKQKAPPKSQAQKPKKNSPSPAPSPVRAPSRHSPSPKPTKYVPPRRELPRDPRIGATNGTVTNNSGGTGDGNPPKMTFAMKMAARRANGGVESASFGSSFSGRFSRGPDSMMGNRGSMNNGGGRFQSNSRLRQRPDYDDSNSNSNGNMMIRPKANK